MANAVSEALEGVKQTVTAPKAAAKNHFWIFVLVLLALAAIAFVFIEKKKPGAVHGAVAKTVGRIPYVGPKVVTALLWIGALAGLGWGVASGHQLHAKRARPIDTMPIIGLGLTRRAVLRRKWVQLSSGQSGDTVDVGLSASEAVKVPWTVKDLPSRTGNYHWHLACLWVKDVVGLAQPSSGHARIEDDQMYATLDSWQLAHKLKMGTIWSKGDTSGPINGLLDARIASGYHLFREPGSGYADGADPGTYEVWHPLFFAQGLNGQPHEFAPHCSLIEGSLLDTYAAPTGILRTNNGGTGPNITSLKRSVIAECWALGEAQLHVPVKYGRYTANTTGTAGKGVRLKLDQMAGKSGMNGVLDSLGVLAMYLMADPTGYGLGGGFTLDQITNVQADFLGIESNNFPEVLMREFLAATGAAREGNPLQTSSLGTFARFPYTEKGTTGLDGNVMKANGLMYPFIMPNDGFQLSKVSKLDMNGEVQVTFNANKAARVYQMNTVEVGQWDPAFMRECLKLIFGPADAGNWDWAQKLSKKQRPERGKDGKLHHPVDADKLRFLPHVAVNLKTGAKAA